MLFQLITSKNEFKAAEKALIESALIDPIYSRLMDVTAEKN